MNIGYANEYSVFEKNDKKGLKDQRGKELIPAEYDDLGWSMGQESVLDGIIGYRNEDHWGIINVNNTRVTGAIFNDLIPFEHNLFIASRPDSYKLNSLFGLINTAGKTIIDFKYNSLKGFGENLVAGKMVRNNLFYGLINKKDELVVPLEYIAAKLVTPYILALKNQYQLLWLIEASGGSLLDMQIDEVEVYTDKFLLITKNGQKGLFDLKGKMIAPLKYQQFYINENGFLNALPTKKWDMLSTDGKLLRSFIYDKIIPIDSGLYKTGRSNFSYIIDDRGQEIFRISNSELRFLNDSLACFQNKNRYGVIHYNGDTIVNPIYDSIRISGNRLFLFTKKTGQSGWTMADLFGMPLTAQVFDGIYHLDDYNLAIEKNGFWGIMDCYGKEKIIAKYDSIYTSMNDLYLVDFYGEKGVVDAAGTWKIYPQKGEVYMLENGNYLISSYFQSRVISPWGNDLYISENYLWPFKYGFIEEDFENNFGLLNREYMHLLPVNNSFVAALVSDSVFLYRNEKGWGLVDIYGNILFENDDRFEEITGYNEGYIGVKIEGYYGFIDLNAKLRIANRYEGIHLFHDGLANIKILGKWGCVNKVEDIMVQPYYDWIGTFKNGLAIARKNGNYGILNRQGKHLIEFEYDSIYRMQNGNFICVLNQNYGLINNLGEIMFYPKYDSILDLDNGYVIAERKNKIGVFSSKGVFIIPVLYDQISFDPYNRTFLASKIPKWEVILDMNQARKY